MTSSCTDRRSTPRGSFMSNHSRTKRNQALSIAARAGGMLLAGLAAATVSVAQPPPPDTPFEPGSSVPPPPETGPQFSGCVDSSGRPLPLVMDLNFAAASTGPF